MTTTENREQKTSDTATERLRLDAAFQRIMKTCKKERLPATGTEEKRCRTLYIWFGQSPDAPPIRVYRLDQAETLLSVNFERYRPLSNYEAVYSSERGEIEAAIGAIGSGPWGGSGKGVLPRLVKATGKTDLRSESAELISQVARRIYELRNLIAHSAKRGQFKDEDVFPKCRYEHRLGFDIRLIQYVARQVITANARRLTV